MCSLKEVAGDNPTAHCHCHEEHSKDCQHCAFDEKHFFGERLSAPIPDREASVDDRVKVVSMMAIRNTARSGIGWRDLLCLVMFWLSLGCREMPQYDVLSPQLSL